MTSILKLIAISSPILFVILYYVYVQQTSITTDIKEDEVRFERSWNEFESDFHHHDIHDKEKYFERAKEADEELKVIKEKAKQAERKNEEFGDAIEQALKETEEELKKKAGDKE